MTGMTMKEILLIFVLSILLDRAISLFECCIFALYERITWKRRKKHEVSGKSERPS